MRRLWLVGLTACLLMATAFPAVAAPASNDNKFVFEFGEEDSLFESELASDYCGFEIEAVFSGWVQIKLFDPGKGARQQDFLAIFHIDVTYSAGGTTYRVLDVGPDHGYRVGDTFYVSITGRSLTGSGVIGHVVIDGDTDEVIFQAGKDHGFYLDGVCEALS